MAPTRKGPKDTGADGIMPGKSFNQTACNQRKNRYNTSMAKGWIQINLNCGAFSEGDQTLNVTRVMEIFWKILADTKKHSYIGRIPDDAPVKHAAYPTPPEAYWQILLKEPAFLARSFEDEHFFEEKSDDGSKDEEDD